MEVMGAVRGRFGLSARLLILTLIFVMLAEVLIYVPSVANFRQNWLANRVSAAVTAALSRSPVARSRDSPMPSPRSQATASRPS